MATRKPANEVSFAEAIVSDAFNPGVRPQSFQALNYVFVALLTTAVIAAYLNNGSIHIYILLGLTTTLAFLINKYKDDILDASNAFEEQQRAAAAKAAAADDEDEDEDEDADEDEDEDEDDDDEAAVTAPTATKSTAPVAAKSQSTPEAALSKCDVAPKAAPEVTVDAEAATNADAEEHHGAEKEPDSERVELDTDNGVRARRA